VGDNTGYFLGSRHFDGNFCVFRLCSLRQYSGDHGVWSRAVLRPDGRYAHVLRHDIRHHRSPHDVHLYIVSCRSRTFVGSMLRTAIYEDKPNLANIQPRSEGDGEAAELHEPEVPAGDMFLSRWCPGDRRCDLDWNGLAAHHAGVSGPEDGRT